MEAKSKLWQLLGNPKEREKWLESLASAQALDKGMDLSKCLWYLQQTEEQCRIAQQIRYTNQMHKQAGGLAQVTTVMVAGVKVQHTNQNDIEIACLNETQSRFTQANDTPCMIALLYNEHNWLGTHLPAFDQIMARMYIPPDQTSMSTQLFFPLMQWPLEVTDQPTTLLLAAHKTGWLKAKEAMASSKSGPTLGTTKQGHSMMTSMKCTHSWWKFHYGPGFHTGGGKKGLISCSKN